MTVRLPLLALWAVSFALLGALYLTVPASPDQALFDYIAWSHLQGDVFYAGAVEQNFPGKMVMHLFGVWLFGAEFWSFRATDLMLLAAVCGAGAGLLARSGFGLAAWLFAVLYPPLYVTSGYWMAGQRDIVAMGVLVGASALMAPSPDRRGAGAALLAGALVAMAVLTRPTYLAALAGLLIFEWLRFPAEAASAWTRRLGRSLALCLGFAAVVGAVAAYGARIGALDDFYQQAILFNLEAYQVPESRMRLLPRMARLFTGSWHWILALALIGAIAWAVVRRLDRTLLLLAGLALTALLSYFAQNKGFDYHLGGLLPLLALLVAVAIDGLVRWRRAATAPLPRMAATAALVAALALMALGTGKKLWNYRDNATLLAGGRFQPLQTQPGQPTWEDIAESVRIIRAGSAPDSFVLQWGRIFVIPFLAERRSTLRFLSVAGLDALAQSFSGYTDWRAEIGRDLQAKRPAFILIDRREVAIDKAALARTPDEPAPPGIDGLLTQALAGYRVVQRTPQYILLEAPE